jgi:hypothetical protein
MFPQLKVIFIILLLIFSGINCSENNELTNLEYELIEALIANFQMVAETYAESPDIYDAQFLPRHIAHLRASVPESFVYAMVIDTNGTIIAYRKSNNDQILSSDDAISKQAMAYRDHLRPLVQYLTLNDGRRAMDVSLPLLGVSNPPEFYGVVRLALLKNK